MKLIYLYAASLLMLSWQVGLKRLEAMVVPRFSRDINDNGMRAVNCDTEMRETCSATGPAHNYSMKISSSVYSPGQEIKVKIFMTHCPKPDLRGPKWYQLEITTNTSQFSDANAPSLGEFYSPRQHMHFCNQRKRILFASCDPKSFDLPASYSWVAPNTPSPREVCFRLTVQEDDSCEEELICIQPKLSESVDQESGDELETNSGSGLDNENYDKDSNLGVLETYYPDLDLTTSEEDNTSSSQNPSNSSESPMSSCESDRQLLLDFSNVWIPHCSCSGHYEPVQCWVNGDKLECWCSSRLMGNIIGPHKSITCTDPSELDFDCDSTR